jgi:hypothetical protein
VADSFQIEVIGRQPAARSVLVRKVAEKRGNMRDLRNSLAHFVKRFLPPDQW